VSRIAHSPCAILLTNPKVAGNVDGPKTASPKLKIYRIQPPRTATVTQVPHVPSAAADDLGTYSKTLVVQRSAACRKPALSEVE